MDTVTNAAILCFQNTMKVVYKVNRQHEFSAKETNMLKEGKEADKNSCITIQHSVLKSKKKLISYQEQPKDEVLVACT